MKIKLLSYKSIAAVVFFSLLISLFVFNSSQSSFEKEEELKADVETLINLKNLFLAPMTGRPSEPRTLEEADYGAVFIVNIGNLTPDRFEKASEKIKSIYGVDYRDYDSDGYNGFLSSAELYDYFMALDKK